MLREAEKLDYSKYAVNSRISINRFWESDIFCKEKGGRFLIRAVTFLGIDFAGTVT